MKMKTVVGLLIVAAILACVSYAGAVTQVLIDDTFNAGVVGNGIESFGWTGPYVGAMTIQADVIDSGFSAGSNDGAWVDYTKDFSARVLADGETAVLTWVGKVSSNSGPWETMSIKVPADDNARSYEMFFGYGYYHYKVYVPTGSNAGVYNSADIPALTPTTLVSKFKIEISKTAQKFYYDDDGTGWQLALETDRALGGGTLSAGVVHLGGQGYLSHWTDSVHYEITGVTAIPSLVGHITLSDYAGSTALAPVKIDVMQAGVVKQTKTVTLDASGNYTLDLLASGTYDVVFTSCKWLKKTVPGVVVGSLPTICNVTLDNGDVDGDNHVTSSDLSVVLKNLE